MNKILSLAILALISFPLSAYSTVKKCAEVSQVSTDPSALRSPSGQKKSLTDDQLRDHIIELAKTKPKFKDNYRMGWDQFGSFHLLTTTIEVKFPGNEGYSEIAIFGYPFKENGGLHLYYKLWRNEHDEYQGDATPSLQKMSVAKFAELSAESFEDRFSKEPEQALFIVPLQTGKNEFSVGSFRRQTEKMIFLEFPNGKIKRFRKDVVFAYQSIFEGSNDSPMVMDFFNGGGEGKLALVTSESGTEYQGLYIFPKKHPKFSSDSYADQEAYASIQNLVLDGVPILIGNSLNGVGGLHLPQGNRILVAVGTALGMNGADLPASLVLNAKTSAGTIVHEKQHYDDDKNDALSEMKEYLNGLDLAKLSKDGLILSDAEWVNLYQLVLEQRGYSAQLNWYRNILSKRDGTISDPNTFIDRKISYREYSETKSRETINIFEKTHHTPALEILKKIKKQAPQVYEDLIRLFAKLQAPPDVIDLVETGL